VMPPLERLVVAGMREGVEIARAHGTTIEV
jgi:hypothetical protein